MKEISFKLIEGAEFISAKDMDEAELPEETGLYCIRVRDMEESGFKGEFRSALIERKSPIIYIGKSDRSTLKKRLFQELRAKSNGTLFRSLGAALGYLPPKGSLKNRKNKNNYKFSKSDEAEIIEWINNHLELSWIELSEDIELAERELIKLNTPLLNLKDNPNPLQVLRDKRNYCKDFANS